MKLMLYNILIGGENRLGLISEVIKKERPNFLVLNEANGFDKNNKLNQFSKEIGLAHSKLSLSGEYDYHTAIFSKYPFKKVVEIKPLRNAGVLAIIETEIGEISVVGTHLSPDTEDSRLPEVDLIMGRQKQYPNRIFMGDINSLAKEDCYEEGIINNFNETQLNKFTTDGKFRFDVINKITSSGYLDSAVIFGKQTMPTVPTEIKEDEAHLVNMRIDYIFISNSLRNRIKSYSVIKNKITEIASDHYPVVVEIK